MKNFDFFVVGLRERNSQKRTAWKNNGGYLTTS
jgi:hypothetical protein